MKQPSLFVKDVIFETVFSSSRFALMIKTLGIHVVEIAGYTLNPISENGN